nr:MAG TPA: hypothetical protein [Caudoviricetes sp.]
MLPSFTPPCAIIQVGAIASTIQSWIYKASTHSL